MAAAATTPARAIRLNAPFVNTVMHMVHGHLYSNYQFSSNFPGETRERTTRYELTVQLANTLADRDEAARLLQQDATFTGAWLMLRPWIEVVLMELERELTAMVDKRRWTGHVINLVTRRMQQIHERVAAVSAIVAVPGASCAPRILPHPLHDLRHDLRSQLAIAPPADAAVVTAQAVPAYV